MKRLAFAVFAVLSLVATSASADPAAPNFTTNMIVVQGRPARPSVSIVLSRPSPGVAITTPTLAAVLKKD